MQNKEKFSLDTLSEVANLGLTKAKKLRTSNGKFFIPVKVLRDKFKGKYLSILNDYYQNDKPRVCHLLSKNGVRKDSVFDKKYAVFPVFWGFEIF